MNSWKDVNPFSRLERLRELDDTFGDFSSFEEYMTRVFQDTMPGSFLQPHDVKSNEKRPAKKGKENYQLYNLHDYIVVHVPLQSGVDRNKMKLYHTSSQLTLDGIVAQDEKLIISLPALVQHKGTHARVKNHLLEICLPKVRDHRLTQIEINEK